MTSQISLYILRAAFAGLASPLHARSGGAL